MTCVRCGDPIMLAYRCGLTNCPERPPCPTRWLHEPLMTEWRGLPVATTRAAYDHHAVPA